MPPTPPNLDEVLPARDPAATVPNDATALIIDRLPGEAFVRLLSGRLDPDHPPTSVVGDGVELDTLRHAFPGG
jgi:hypothetical protein